MIRTLKRSLTETGPEELGEDLEGLEDVGDEDEELENLEEELEEEHEGKLEENTNKNSKRT